MRTVINTRIALEYIGIGILPFNFEPFRRYSFCLGLLDLDILGIPLALALGLKLGILTLALGLLG